MVGYAHLDPVWLWPWTEGYAEARATLRSAVDRMDEFPEFIFTFTSVLFLEWVAESDPELFARIAARVADGRFHLAGGWWVEPDCNLPSGEALVRQALVGQRFLADHFGVIATVGGNPDSFGHAATLPQILAGAGLSGYFFQRPESHEAELPGAAFTWRGPDGTKVVACRIIPRYCSESTEMQAHVRDGIAGAGANPAVLLFYGVGNHGGGPTRRNLESLRRIHATTPAADLVCSTPRGYLDALAAGDEQLPDYGGELQHHARGCYAAHAGVKSWNRRAEAALATAETWATVAHAVAGLPYPSSDLGRAWRSLLLNQFHDTLAGTAIESAYDDARNQLGETLAIAQRATNAALSRLTRHIAIPDEDDMQPLVVCNPHPWPVRGVVECEVGGWAKRMDLVDGAGRPVPLQWGTSEALTGERYRAVFTVDLPPLGYRLYRLRLGPCRVPTPPVPPAGTTLENDHLLVEVDPATGCLARLVHKPTGADLGAGARDSASGAGGHAVVLVDEADTWGHGRDRWDDQTGCFTVERVERVEHGPARTVVRVISRYEASRLVEDYQLGAGDAWVDVAVTLDWRERRRMLKLAWPTALAGTAVTAECAYGTVVRPADGTEQPMQRFVDVTGTVAGRTAGLAVANDAKYAYDVGVDGAHSEDGGRATLRITVARSVPYAHHDPAVVPAGDTARRLLDLGDQRFTLRLMPHAGDWRAAGVWRRAAELNQRPACATDTYHAGGESCAGSFAAVDGDHAGAFVLKRAEA
ncbi:MAG: alpha-mannosidase, partial [Actinomycetota bacterium]|nr:alpha-mannosidase [Actinomycetota bacterium]